MAGLKIWTFIYLTTLHSCQIYTHIVFSPIVKFTTPLLDSIILSFYWEKNYIQGKSQISFKDWLFGLWNVWCIFRDITNCVNNICFPLNLHGDCLQWTFLFCIKMFGTIFGKRIKCLAWDKHLVRFSKAMTALQLTEIRTRVIWCFEQ